MYLGEDIIVKIGSEDWLGTTTIYLVAKDQRATRLARPVELVFEPVEEGVIAEPTLRMDTAFARQLFIALAEALDEQGVNTLKDANLEGVLEATKYHLEDMRLLAGVKKGE